jgi:bacillithiol system protein YtxJ
VITLSINCILKYKPRVSLDLPRPGLSSSGVRPCEVFPGLQESLIGDKMSDNLLELNSIQELDVALTESNARPVLLFKHSLTCPISTHAFGELRSYLNNPDPRISYKLITVQTARAVSDEAASRLHVRHQSPQAILVKGGAEIWHASHYDITAEALEQAIRTSA